MNRRKLTIELNHHVRNALQLIASSFAEADELERLRICREASQRIVRVLDRYLPMPGRPSSNKKEERQIEEERIHPRRQD